MNVYVAIEGKKVHIRNRRSDVCLCGYNPVSYEVSPHKRNYDAVTCDECKEVYEQKYGNLFQGFSADQLKVLRDGIMVVLLNPKTPTDRDVARELKDLIDSKMEGDNE